MISKVFSAALSVWLERLCWNIFGSSSHDGSINVEIVFYILEPTLR